MLAEACKALFQAFLREDVMNTMQSQSCKSPADQVLVIKFLCSDKGLTLVTLLLLELIDSPIDQQTSRDRELLSELIDSPISQQTSRNRELLLELINSPIDQQTSSDRELLSELIDSLISQQTSCDRELLLELVDSPIDQKRLVIGSSF